jgi:hypothetical protein
LGATSSPNTLCFARTQRATAKGCWLQYPSLHSSLFEKAEYSKAAKFQFDCLLALVAEDHLDVEVDLLIKY